MMLNVKRIRRDTPCPPMEEGRGEGNLVHRLPSPPRLSHGERGFRAAVILLLLMATAAVAGWCMTVTTIGGETVGAADPLLLASFAQLVESAAGAPAQHSQPARQPEFVGLEQRPQRFEVIDPDVNFLKRFIENRAG